MLFVNGMQEAAILRVDTIIQQEPFPSFYPDYEKRLVQLIYYGIPHDLDLRRAVAYAFFVKLIRRDGVDTSSCHSYATSLSTM